MWKKHFKILYLVKSILVKFWIWLKSICVWAHLQRVSFSQGSGLFMVSIISHCIIKVILYFVCFLKYLKMENAMQVTYWLYASSDKVWNSLGFSCLLNRTLVNKYCILQPTPWIRWYWWYSDTCLQVAKWLCYCKRVLARQRHFAGWSLVWKILFFSLFLFFIWFLRVFAKHLFLLQTIEHPFSGAVKFWHSMFQ